MNGFVAGYEATGLEGYGKAVVTFFEKLTQHHSYVTGGSNQGESWGPADNVADAITDVRGPASSIPARADGTFAFATPRILVSQKPHQTQRGQVLRVDCCSKLPGYVEAPAEELQTSTSLPGNLQGRVHPEHLLHEPLFLARPYCIGTAHRPPAPSVERRLRPTCRASARRQPTSHSSQPTAHSPQLTAHSSQLTAHSSQPVHVQPGRALFTEETCTQYNVLKVARALFRHTGHARLADLYETAILNGILGTQRMPAGYTSKPYHGSGQLSAPPQRLSASSPPGQRLGQGGGTLALPGWGAPLVENLNSSWSQQPVQRADWRAEAMRRFPGPQASLGQALLQKLGQLWAWGMGQVLPLQVPQAPHA